MVNLQINESLKRELVRRYAEQIQLDVPLKQLSRWHIGGKADVIITPNSKESLVDIRSWLFNRGLHSVVLGSTSNLLFSDQGLRAIAIQLDSRMSKIQISENNITAESGVWIPGLARKTMSCGLSGLEHTCGIPGTLGGLVYMNGGSQRKGIGSVVRWVESVDERGNVIRRNQADCQFGYRQSYFQQTNEIISSAQLELSTAADRREIRSTMLAILKDRRQKFPLKQPNCGSVFVSDPAMYELVGPPGKVIENLGFKGFECGDAQVSLKHANFIVNNGSASSQDVLRLINKIGTTVFAETGFIMKVEAKYVSVHGDIEDITFI